MCRQHRTDTDETSLRLVGADATPPKCQVPTCTLIMFIIVWTTYIYLPKRHTACRQHRINVNAYTPRYRRCDAAETSSANIYLVYAQCHLDYIYRSTLEAYNVSADRINSNATQRRRVGADATLFKRQAPTCILFICIFTCVTYICLPRRHVNRSSTRVLAIQNALQFASLVFHYNITQELRYA